MKIKITNLIVLCQFLSFGVVAQINTPQPSSAGSVSSTIGLTEVTIDYFRPKMKGRKIFGEGSDYLQPYGQLWRSGANSGSKLTLSEDVKIGGQDVKAGEYLIFTVPGASEWKFKLYSDLSLGGNVSEYKKENEVLEVTVMASRLTTGVETLTFNISDISKDNAKANIELLWADVSVKVPMEVSFDDAVMKEIAEKTKVNPVSYVQAANYYLDAGKDFNQALKWVNLYLSMGDNSGQFWHVHTKAKILAALGNKKEAVAAAEDSMEKAKNFAQGDFGYIKLNEDLIAQVKKSK